jgi:hypothetical protein
MDRRTLLKALGLTGAGGAVITSTGAFTSVEANRDVAVQVSDDANAYLAIDDTGNANDEYVTETNGEFGLDFTGSNSTSESGSGVNADAVTVFEDLFEVSNQGTQTVETEVTPLSFIEPSGGDSELIVLVVPQTGFPKVTIDPGETETYDLIVTATDAATTSTSLSETITVSGEAP